MNDKVQIRVGDDWRMISGMNAQEGEPVVQMQMNEVLASCLSPDIVEVGDWFVDVHAVVVKAGLQNPRLDWSGIIPCRCLGWA
jgi:hypothetical protein